MKTTAYLLLPVSFDEDKTDLESLSRAVDHLVGTATSTPGILDDYGPVEIGLTELPVAMTWRIEVLDQPPEFFGSRQKRWRDTGEGPFDTAAHAEHFARTEVGASWRLVGSP
jgi:hypothetical protein